MISVVYIFPSVPLQRQSSHFGDNHTKVFVSRSILARFRQANPRSKALDLRFIITKQEVNRCNSDGIILAGCHVHASAGDLAVHGALIPCVCLSVSPVSNSFLITPRIGTKFVSVDR